MSVPQSKKYIPPHLRGDRKPSHSESVPAGLTQLEESIFHASATYRRLLKQKVEFDSNRATYLGRIEDREGEKDLEPVVLRVRRESEDTMHDINEQSQGSLLDLSGTFLDLNCAPGGFSKWILEHNANIQGVGVVLEDATRSRMQVEDWEEDTLRKYDIRRMESFQSDLWAKEIPFDLVIATGRRGIPTFSTSGARRKEPRAVFTVSQLVEALRALKEGGTALLVSFLSPTPSTVGMFFLIQQAFERLTSTTGRTPDQRRAHYYLLCEGYNSLLGEKAIQGLLRGARGGERAWMDVVKEGSGPGRLLTEDRQAALLKHFEPLWEVQMKAIQGFIDNAKAEGEGQSSGSVIHE